MSKKAKVNNALINAALYILVGVLLCIFRSAVLNWAMTAIGAVLIVFGVLKIVKSELVEGIVMAAIGLLIILGGWLFVDIILLILGIALAAKGILDLIKGIGDKNTPVIVAAAIMTLIGIALIVCKWFLVDWLFIIIGGVLIIDGVLMALGKKVK